MSAQDRASIALEVGGFWGGVAGVFAEVIGFNRRLESTTLTKTDELHDALRTIYA